MIASERRQLPPVILAIRIFWRVAGRSDRDDYTG